MAVTEFGTNDAQTVKLWSKMLAHETIWKTYWRKFMGTGDDAIIQRVTELEQSRGDEVKYDLLMQMSQYGVTGDNPIKGFEEALTYHQDSLRIDQRRFAHAFRTMSQQRTIHGLRRDARRNLADRYATVMDEFMFAYLAGTAGDSTALAAALPHAGNTLTVPDSDHVLTKAETFRTDHIEILMERSATVAPLLRPAVVDGEELFILIVHPYELTDLRTNASSTDWKDMVSQAGARGVDNPLFKYAAIRWANVLVHVSPRVIIDGATAHSLFLGQQSGCMAFGNAYSRLRQGVMGGENMFSWFEDTDDYGNEMGVAAGSINGLKKTRFNSADFGMIRLTANAAAH